jgi:hypothetical protein
MHMLIGLAVLAVLTGFAFGMNTARAFVGALLSFVALGALMIIGIAAVDIIRQERELPASNSVQMGSSR